MSDAKGICRLCFLWKSSINCIFFSFSKLVNCVVLIVVLRSALTPYSMHNNYNTVLSHSQLPKREGKSILSHSPEQKKMLALSKFVLHVYCFGLKKRKLFFFMYLCLIQCLFHSLIYYCKYHCYLYRIGDLKCWCLSFENNQLMLIKF